MREKKGLLYDIRFSFSVSALERGFAVVRLSPSADRLDAAVREALSVLRRLHREGFSAEAFERVHGPFVARLRTALHGNALWSSALAHVQADDVPQCPARMHHIVARYAALTRDDVLDWAHDFFRAEGMHVVVGQGGSEAEHKRAAAAEVPDVLASDSKIF